MEYEKNLRLESNSLIKFKRINKKKFLLSSLHDEVNYLKNYWVNKIDNKYILKENELKQKKLSNIIYNNYLKLKNYKNNNDSNYKKEEELFKINKNEINIDISDIKNFNKNLLILNNVKNLNKKFVDQKSNEISDKNFYELKDKNFYSELLLKISKKITNNNHKEYISTPKPLLNLKPLKKSNEEKLILENCFKENKFKWGNELIQKLSLKLNLPKIVIYKWNWNKIKRYNKAK